VKSIEIIEGWPRSNCDSTSFQSSKDIIFILTRELDL
jgi:hypothetical protein